MSPLSRHENTAKEKWQMQHCQSAVIDTGCTSSVGTTGDKHDLLHTGKQSNKLFAMPNDTRTKAKKK
jgi:hypothetical protein